MKGKIIFTALGSILGPVGAAAGFIIGESIDNDLKEKGIVPYWLRSHNGYVLIQCPKCTKTDFRKICKTTDYTTCQQCSQKFEFLIDQRLLTQNIHNKSLTNFYLFYLYGCIAGADGEYSKNESDFMSELFEEFNFPKEDKEKYQTIFAQGFERKDYEYAAVTLGNIFRAPSAAEERREIASSFFKLAAVSGVLRSPQVEVAIRSTAHGLGYSEQETKVFLDSVIPYFLTKTG